MTDKELCEMMYLSLQNAELEKQNTTFREALNELRMLTDNCQMEPRMNEIIDTALQRAGGSDA